MNLGLDRNEIVTEMNDDENIEEIVLHDSSNSRNLPSLHPIDEEEESRDGIASKSFRRKSIQKYARDGIASKSFRRKSEKISFVVVE